MEAAVIAATIVATRVLPPETYLWVNVGYSCLFAAAGGYLAATLAGQRGTLHGTFVAVLIVLLGLLSGVEAGRDQPSWYPAMLTFGAAASAVFGGYLCSRFRRLFSAGHHRGTKKRDHRT
jgi:putative membrane protein (TIGR04086 family)